MPILSQIYVYPVKSLAGIQVNQWPVDKTGLRYDRKWMLINAEGKFLSQRSLPKMALIKTAISGEKLRLSVGNEAGAEINLNSSDGDEVQVEIWQDNCIAKTASLHASQWLSRFLDMPCRLVYHPEEQVRKVDPDYANAKDETAYSDGFPFLIASESSLQALNQAMSMDISMLRFRPNLVVAECDSYAEDFWRQITINGISFRLPKPCSRCPIPAIDPDTAIVGKEPLTTLARLRKWQNKVYFGQNALHDNLGVLSTGSEIRIDKTGESQPPRVTDE